jgi:hypothetical protein
MTTNQDVVSSDISGIRCRSVSVTVTESEKGWFAGIIDGEGCITISNDCRRKNYPILRIVNTDAKIINELKRISDTIMPECYSIYKDKTNIGSKDKWTMIWTGIRCQKIIESIYNYINSEKKSKAIMVLQWTNGNIRRRR